MVPASWRAQGAVALRQVLIQKMAYQRFINLAEFEASLLQPIRKVCDAAQILTDGPRRIPAPNQIARIGLIARFEHAVRQPCQGPLRYEFVVHDASPQKAELAGPPPEESTFIMRSLLPVLVIEHLSQHAKRVSVTRNCA